MKENIKSKKIKMKVNILKCPKCGRETEGIFRTNLSTTIFDKITGYNKNKNINEIIKYCFNCSDDLMDFHDMNKLVYYECICGHLYDPKKIKDSSEWIEREVDGYECGNCRTYISCLPDNESLGNPGEYLCFKCLLKMKES